MYAENVCVYTCILSQTRSPQNNNNTARWYVFEWKANNLTLCRQTCITRVHSHSLIQETIRWQCIFSFLSLTSWPVSGLILRSVRGVVWWLFWFSFNARTASIPSLASTSTIFLVSSSAGAARRGSSHWRGLGGGRRREGASSLLTIVGPPSPSLSAWRGTQGWGWFGSHLAGGAAAAAGAGWEVGWRYGSWATSRSPSFSFRLRLFEVLPWHSLSQLAASLKDKESQSVREWKRTSWWEL